MRHKLCLVTKDKDNRNVTQQQQHQRYNHITAFDGQHDRCHELRQQEEDVGFKGSLLVLFVPFLVQQRVNNNLSCKRVGRVDRGA